ncbi:MAG: DUF1959 domain-containing protein, partial [Methanobacterium sp.]|nr:DUF1959 domain-containing protein [Methanobacterium sp.]
MDDNESLLELMKSRIVTSFRWREDIVLPLADELGIKKEEMEQILMRNLDMSSLEALHPRFESAHPRCLKERIHADLRLCYLSDVMEIVSGDDSEKITTKISKEVLDG